MIKIFKGNRGNIDFQEPIKMNFEQRKKFIALMKEMFETIDVEEVGSLYRQRIGEKNFQKKWTYEEYVLLIFKEVLNIGV